MKNSMGKRLFSGVTSGLLAVMYTVPSSMGIPAYADETAADDEDAEAGEVAGTQTAGSSTAAESILELADGDGNGNPFVSSVE